MTRSPNPAAVRSMPSARNVGGKAMRTQFPMAFSPSPTISAPHPIAANPNMIWTRRRANHFDLRRGRRFGHHNFFSHHRRLTNHDSAFHTAGKNRGRYSGNNEDIKFYFFHYFILIKFFHLGKQRIFSAPFGKRRLSPCQILFFCEFETVD